MEIYITKYALSRGIMVAEGEKTDIQDFVKVGKDLFNPKEWTSTLSEARVRAETMKLQKIQYHKRGIERLQQLDFAKVRKYPV